MTTPKTITLITGANKGIGYEAARQLLSLGHTVYLGARSSARGEAAAAEIGAQFVQLDVTDDASVEAAMQLIGAREGRLDVLVNNAGIAGSTMGAVGLTGPDALAVFNTNAVGTIRVTQAALGLLRKSENPRVVNVSSGLGSFGASTDPKNQSPQSAFVVYGASKAAVSMITVQYAKAIPGIKFNAIEPGYTATDFTAALGGGQPPADAAKVIVRLASIEKDGPTGTFSNIDGKFPW